MPAAPAFTAPPPQPPARRPAPSAHERPIRPPLSSHDGGHGATGVARGEPTKFSSIDPLLCRIGLVALIVAAGVAVTVYLLRHLLPAEIGTEPGLWSIAAEVRHMITARFHYF
jgi:hypothetical protein